MQVVLDTEVYELRTGRYASGDLSLNIIDRDGSPVAELSLDLPGVVRSTDEIILKAYGENQEIAAQILTAKILTQTPRYTFVGGAFCPVCKVAAPNGRRKRTPVSEEEVPQPSTLIPQAGDATCQQGQSRDSH